MTANKNVLSIYDKPIAIVYARYNRSSMLVLVHFISNFHLSSNTICIAATKAAGTVYAYVYGENLYRRIIGIA